MGGEVTDDGGRVDFNGQTVGFCCPGCIEQWNALPDHEKEAKLAASDNPATDMDDHRHHESHATHTVGEG